MVGTQAVEQLRMDNGSERMARALRDSYPLPVTTTIRIEPAVRERTKAAPNVG